MRKNYFLIFLCLWVYSLFPIEELQVQQQCSFAPLNNSYNLVMGDSNGILHFYTAEIEADSVWISEFTCDSDGNYSEKLPINSVIYPTLSESEGTLINMEYKYNKLYTHVLHDSTLIVLINLSNGNVDNHIINTYGQQFYYNGLSSLYYLFKEYTIFSTYFNKIYQVDLLSNQLNIFYEHPTWCYYNQYNFSDDFILFISAMGFNFYINRSFNQFPLSDEYNHWSYYSSAYIGNRYHLTNMYNELPEITNYKVYYIENDILCNFDIIPDSLEQGVSYRDFYTNPLDNTTYICIRKAANEALGIVYYYTFSKYNIINNQVEYSPSFPNLEYLSNPISLHRINDQAIIALSADENGTTKFTAVDLNREQLNTQSFNVGLLNEYNFSIISAGDFFYLLKDNSIYSFKLETVLNNDPNIVPSLPQLSCYPNPFNDQIKIISSEQFFTNTSLNVFDIKGKKIKTLLKDQKLNKNQEIIWDAFNDQGHKVPSGVYFLKFDNEKNHQIKKILLIK